MGLGLSAETKTLKSYFYEIIVFMSLIMLILMCVVKKTKKLQ